MGVWRVQNEIDERVLEIAAYIVENNETVRGTAARFGCSKSTVHKYMTRRLEQLDPSLYCDVRKVLDVNKAERHIRGGMATRKKYEEYGAKKQRHIR